MTELLYMWINSVNNRANYYQQGICFTNDYDIKTLLDKKTGKIIGIDIQEKENLYSDFFSEKIKNINVLVGINGVGKTTILELLGSTRGTRNTNVGNWSYFILYKYNDSYILEGCNNEDIDKLVDFSNARYPISPEYSIICEYDAGNKNFKYKELCVEYENYGLEFYYQCDSLYYDTKDYFDVKDNIRDDPICFKRNFITINDAELYRFLTSKSLNELDITLNDDFYFKISVVDGDIWEGNEDNQTIKKFLFKLMDCLNMYFTNHKPEYRKIDLNEAILTLCENFIDYNKNNDKLEIKHQLDELKKIINDIPEEEIGGKKVERKKTWPINMRRRQKESDLEILKNAKEEVHLKIYELLKYTNKIVNYYDDGPLKEEKILKVKCPNISAGEKRILEVMAGINSCVENVFNPPKGNRTRIILLDEPEKGFHPELARRFINQLVDMITKLKEENVQYQIIITTHSPFVLSDIPESYIHTLVYEEESTKIKSSNIGLLQDIPNIMKDTFFLKSPIGEYAEKYFNKILKEIEIIKEDEYESIQKKINDIHNPVFQMYLQKCLDEQLAKVKTKEELRNYYKKKLAELE